MAESMSVEVVDDVPETFSDRFLDVVLDKGALWALGGSVVLLVVVLVVQIRLAFFS